MDEVRGFSSVVFDCDSTLVSVEGIDELAPGDPVIAELTREAMDGERTLESVYAARLERIRPPRSALEALGERYVGALVPDSAEVVRALCHLRKEVRIVSGGVRSAVLAVARHLGVADDQVAAVEVYHDDDGEYAGFEESSPLARSDGKAEVIEAWALPRPTLLVGDGMSDLAARSAVDAFAAFSGVVRRMAVEERADAVLAGPGLSGVLSLSASADDRTRLRAAGWRELLARGDRDFARR